MNHINNGIHKHGLNIFNNSKKIIAPSDTGQYNFTVQNITKKNIKIDVFLEDINISKINMKYRLKQDGKYVIGNENIWENIEKIKLLQVDLNKNQLTVYTLDWKWEDSQEDTNIGINEAAKYTLQITVKGY